MSMSMNTTKPNYYAIITADVRYDERLSANEKLMYGEITALTQSTGECWASNAYFSKLYNKDVRTIRRWVSHLSELGYIDVKLVYKTDSKEVDKRIITLRAEVSLTSGQKCPTGGDKNVLDNNTRENNTSIIDEWFDKVWAKYGRKGNKQSALRYWRKLSDKDRKEIEASIPAYLASREPQFRKDFSGYINPTYKRWQDEIVAKEEERMKL